jgi:hypothetical protein
VFTLGKPIDENLLKTSFIQGKISRAEIQSSIHSLKTKESTLGFQLKTKNQKLLKEVASLKSTLKKYQDKLRKQCNIEIEEI